MCINWLRPAPPPDHDDAERSLASQLFWFAALSLGSLLAVSITAYALRGLLFL